MSKKSTPHFNDMVAARGGAGASAGSAPGFKAPGTAAPAPPMIDDGMDPALNMPPGGGRDSGKSGKSGKWK